jgi:hypothetical protein
MTNLDKMRELHTREQEALSKYRETNDPKYLNNVKNYIDERLKLVSTRASGFGLEKLNEEKP